jgi:hypothetical protein
MKSAISRRAPLDIQGTICPTICRAAMQTVLIENLRPHISKRSSKLGPRRSMTCTGHIHVRHYNLRSPKDCHLRECCVDPPVQNGRFGVYRLARVMTSVRELYVMGAGQTHGSWLGSDRSGIRPAAGVLQLCEAPTRTPFTFIRKLWSGRGTATYEFDRNSLGVEQVGT